MHQRANTYLGIFSATLTAVGLVFAPVGLTLLILSDWKRGDQYFIVGAVTLGIGIMCGVLYCRARCIAPPVAAIDQSLTTSIENANPVMIVLGVPVKEGATNARDHLYDSDRDPAACTV